MKLKLIRVIVMKFNFIKLNPSNYNDIQFH